MKAKILEMFDSIQGEGQYAGVKQVFVRFFECNMHCSWCDTPHSIGDTSRKYIDYSVDELFEKIKSLWSNCHSISVTGGEPLMQAGFIKILLPYLVEAKMPVHLETNGIFHKELKDVINNIDVIAMDIKLPSSTGCSEYWDSHHQFLKVALEKEVFIKTVISSNTTIDDVISARDLVADINKDVVFILQPNTYDMGPELVSLCSQYYDECSQSLNNVRILPQMHKMLKVR